MSKTYEMFGTIFSESELIKQFELLSLMTKIYGDMRFSSMTEVDFWDYYHTQVQMFPMDFVKEHYPEEYEWEMNYISPCGYGWGEMEWQNTCASAGTPVPRTMRRYPRRTTNT